MTKENIREQLSKLFPHVGRMSARALKTELKSFQAFLNDPHSAIGRQDMYYEQALILELNSREK